MCYPETISLRQVNCKYETYKREAIGNFNMKHGKIKQCISDHGSQFISNIGGDSKFVEYLEAKGIKQILCRIKHPQSNGKIEKWFDIYRLHRHAFKTKEEFLYWYNEVRPHRSLNFAELETPQQAFVRKMKAEV